MPGDSLDRTGLHVLLVGDKRLSVVPTEAPAGYRAQRELLRVGVVRVLFTRLNGEGQSVLWRRHGADGEVVGERAR